MLLCSSSSAKLFNVSSKADLTRLAFPVLRFFMEVAGLKGSTDTSILSDSFDGSFSFCRFGFAAATIENEEERCGNCGAYRIIFLYFLFLPLFKRDSCDKQSIALGSACLSHFNSVRGISSTFTTSSTLTVASSSQEDGTGYLEDLKI